MFDDTQLLSIRQEFADIFRRDSKKLSPQLAKRLQLLLETLKTTTCCDINSTKKIFHIVSSVFNRLLLEILQAHYNTKQRERDALRIIESKNCILEPNLTDTVINSLIKLNKADGVRCGDTYYERKVLVKFLLNELQGEQKYSKNQIEKVIQTLYRCSCFQIITKQGAPSGLKIKEELQNFTDIRLKHDSELIKLVQSCNIRLTPESWCYLLYRSSNPDILSRIQSLLDKNQNPVTVNEIHEEIEKIGDRYNILDSLKKLQHIQNLIEDQLKINEFNNLKILESVLNDLLMLSSLFTIRQSRASA